MCFHNPSKPQRQTGTRSAVNHLTMMLMLGICLAAAAAIGANIFHKSALSTAHMLSHTSPHACGKC